MQTLLEILKVDSASQVKKIKKGKILLQAGETSKKAYYVKSGLLRSYTIDGRGKEHVFMFAPEGWLIGDLESMEFNKPAELVIECLEDSEVIEIYPQNIDASKWSVPEIRENMNRMARRIGVLQRRVIMLMSATARERYEHFLETYPELPNRVPQKLIASYLGITPEALSKIRGEMARSK